MYRLSVEFIYISDDLQKKGHHNSPFKYILKGAIMDYDMIHCVPSSLTDIK